MESKMEGIVHVRIDDRLLHGQVCAFWTNTLKLTRIMVANDAVAVDEMQKSVLRMAAPTGIRTSLISLETAAQNILAGKYQGQKVLLILKTPEDALRLIKLGLPITEINVGNMANRPNTTQYKRSISLTDKEYDQFMELHEKGIRLTARMIPEDPATELMTYLKK
ncbi:MAG: PTS sugar transporter subunit IIB [Erysipelotrichaceae bacterium]